MECTPGMPGRWRSARAAGTWTHLVHRGTRGLRDAAPRVGGKRIEVATAPLGIKRAQSQRTLARARDTGDTHELMQRNIDVDILEVMHASTAHLDGAGQRVS